MDGVYRAVRGVLYRARESWISSEWIRRCGVRRVRGDVRAAVLEGILWTTGVCVLWVSFAAV